MCALLFVLANTDIEPFSNIGVLRGCAQLVLELVNRTVVRLTVFYGEARDVAQFPNFIKNGAFNATFSIVFELYAVARIERFGGREQPHHANLYHVIVFHKFGNTRLQVSGDAIDERYMVVDQ